MHRGWLVCIACARLGSSPKSEEERIRFGKRGHPPAGTVVWTAATAADVAFFCLGLWSRLPFTLQAPLSPTAGFLLALIYVTAVVLAIVLHEAKSSQYLGVFLTGECRNA